MLKNKLIIILLLILIIFFINSNIVYSKTLTVGNTYKTINQAINDANNGDIIEVQKGLYNEQIVIKKAITLKGVGAPEIVISKDYTIEIKSPDVIIEGLTFISDGRDNNPASVTIFIDKSALRAIIKDNIFIKTMTGISNFEGSDLRIENNKISGRGDLGENDRGNCINLTGSQAVAVIGNKLDNCRDGIYMEVCHHSTVVNNEVTKSRFSIHTMWVDEGHFNNNVLYDNLVGLNIMYTKHSDIKGNICVGNRTIGLILNQTVRSEVTDNILISNTKGLFFHNSIYNNISRNLIMNNNLGLHCLGGSVDNKIWNNSFIQNEFQVKFVAAKNQFWDNNYWSDYIGWDVENDGKGDIPYETNTIVDQLFWRYPLSKMLFSSPALHVLIALEKQFPIIKTPRVVDKTPSMKPFHPDWKKLLKQYAAYKPQQYYGEMEKIANMSGGGF
ncbi:MAG: nitrous oxide reductase family maturation protein NosD [Nitrospirae bacterium]|nr:nitrous oxide reductase family maturation protein NosD [Nitrospirota bacterium]